MKNRRLSIHDFLIRSHAKCCMSIVLDSSSDYLSFGEISQNSDYLQNFCSRSWDMAYLDSSNFSRKRLKKKIEKMFRKY